MKVVARDGISPFMNTKAYDVPFSFLETLLFDATCVKSVTHDALFEAPESSVKNKLGLLCGFMWTFQMSPSYCITTLEAGMCRGCVWLYSLIYAFA